MADTIRETLRLSERVVNNESKDDTIFDEIKVPKVVDDRFGNYQEQQPHKQEVHHFDFDESKSNQRNAKIDIKMKVMRQVEENMKNIHKEVK